MGASIRSVFDNLRSAAFGAIGANYTLVGSLFSHEVRVVVLVNNTDQLLLISDDGVNDKLALTAGMGLVLDISSNKTNISGKFSYGGSDGIWVKHDGVAPTSGNLYVSIMHGRGE